MTRSIINNSLLNELASRILSGKPNPLKNWIVMLIVVFILLLSAIDSLFAGLFHGTKFNSN